MNEGLFSKLQKGYGNNYNNMMGQYQPQTVGNPMMKKGYGQMPQGQSLDDINSGTLNNFSTSGGISPYGDIGVADIHNMGSGQQWMHDNLGGLGDGINSIGNGVSNWWGGLSGKDQIGAVTGGLSGMSSLWNAYNQQKYASKEIDLKNRAQSFYEQQLNRQNQRQDLAQKNYNDSFKPQGVIR